MGKGRVGEEGAGARPTHDLPGAAQERGMVQGRPTPAVSLVHIRSVLQEEFTDDQGTLGGGWGVGSNQADQQKWSLTGPLSPHPLPPNPPTTPPWAPQQDQARSSAEGKGPACTPWKGANPRPLTPSTACTSGVLPSSSASAQLTSAPCARAAASAGRSLVRAARCASSPGCSSRTSARPQASASPSASPLDSSDSAASARRGRSGPLTWPAVGDRWHGTGELHTHPPQ